MKYCPGCETYKSLVNFYRDGSREDGLKEQCKECCYENGPRWRNQHRKRETEKARSYRLRKESQERINKLSRRWGKENREKYREGLEKSHRHRKEQNREKVNQHSHRRYIREQGAEGSHTLKEWKLMKERYNYTCPDCGRKEPEIYLTRDHVIPLSKGGSDYIKNIQPLCGSCNSRKYTKIKIYAPIEI